MFAPNVAKLKDKKDSEGLIRALSYKKDAEIREISARVLGEIGDERAIGPLRARAKINSHF